MIAYKGFRKDLTCTMGKGIFQYEIGKWYKEDKAHCGADGFHATENPLDVLAYYSQAEDRYCIVKLNGDIDEDGTNSRISAPEIKLLKEITKDELYQEGVIWMSSRPKAQWAAVVKRETGDADGEGNVVVRGIKPKAKGKKGDKLYIVKEDENGMIIEIGAYVIDGEQKKEEIYYDVKGDEVDAKEEVREVKNA